MRLSPPAPRKAPSASSRNLLTSYRSIEPMRVAAYISLVLGLAVAIGLIAWRGFDTVAAAMGALGLGVLLLPLIYAPHIVGAASSWSLLFPEDRRPPFRITLHALWVGISVETM